MKIVTTLLTLFLLLTLVGCNKKKAQTETRNLDSLPTLKPKTEILLPKQTERISKKDIKFLDCEAVLIEILKSSPRYKQITEGLKMAVIKNGGTDFGVSMKVTQDTELNKLLNSSKIYEFTVFEIYPDRQLNTSRFTFNPSNNQLFEYDVVNDKLRLIEYDKALLEQFDAKCK